MNTASQNLLQATVINQRTAQELAGTSELVESSRECNFNDDVASDASLIQIKERHTESISKRLKFENKTIRKIAKNNKSETKKKKSKLISESKNEKDAQTHVINNGENIDESFDSFIQITLDHINCLNIPDIIFFTNTK